MSRSMTIAIFTAWILLSVSAFSICATAAPLPDTIIKVRVLKLGTSFDVTGIGLRFGGSQVADMQSLSALPVKKSASINYHNGTWNVAYDGRELNMIGSRLEVNGETLKVNGQKVPSFGGFVAAERKSKSTVDYVASLDIEDYLVDVVASELPFGWPLEAQKAQAVAARSYAMSIMKERRKEKFHIDSTTLHQVYQFGRSGWKGVKQRERIRLAVQSTQGVTLADSRGRLLKSYFHAHCGGQTEEPREVWGVGPKFGIVNDTGCAISTAGLWRTQIPFSEVIHRLSRTRNGPTPITIQNIEMKYQEGSQRVDSVVITALEGQVKMKAQAFREMFGYDRVKSTLFTSKIEGNVISLTGHGHGHGVGMCQTGAKMMALAGAKYDQILNRYYPLAKIIKPAPLQDERVIIRAETAVSKN